MPTGSSTDLTKEPVPDLQERHRLSESITFGHRKRQTRVRDWKKCLFLTVSQNYVFADSVTL